MNPAFLRYYSQELQHVREMGGEFAAAFPKIAARLALDGVECADPYVERLLEGFGFLAARVQMKLDAEFPRFTQHLLELAYPHYLAPTPSMAVVQLHADHANPQLAASADGIVVPRHTALRGMLDKSASTRCEYRTAHALTLWPVGIAQAKFFTLAGSLDASSPVFPANVKAGLRLRLRATGSLGFDRLSLDRLPLYLRGPDGLPARLHERLLARCVGVAVMQPGDGASAATTLAVLPKTALRPLGFAEDEALLPVGQQSFDGYRLLQEYFAFAPRFMFVELHGLRGALRHCRGQEAEIVILLDQADASLERGVDASNFALDCTPAINLFRRRTDRVALSDTEFEYHVVVDRTRPMDYEIHQIDEVTGYGAGAAAEKQYRPFHCAKDLDMPGEGGAFYQLRREARRASVRQQQNGARSSYLGSEAFIALVDANAREGGEVRQLGIGAWCTNRDLPLSMPIGAGSTDFTLDAEAPVTAVRCVAGPSRPLPSFAEGPAAWRLLDHLSLNYASLVDTNAQEGARALRELLALYCPADDAAAHRQVEGLSSVSCAPVVRRLPSPGPIVYGRGLAITLRFDDAAFEGASAFLLGAVLAQFFAQYVSINSFTETHVASLARGPLMQWPARTGRCATL
ncbi:type VI secretion protein [Caballeronia catudaia]|uniref:Type VI secretion protein n=1 Tax=Caballeronia catudaia TaxID=1777136 RepID=A0A158CSG8_9BURK|nr:type VI secretion system baseplate subunit TssF [Caballeronia catudaia]SAK84537.1 type VI secretion protein [Caballeronia catudaia]